MPVITVFPRPKPVAVLKTSVLRVTTVVVHRIVVQAVPVAVLQKVVMEERVIQDPIVLHNVVIRTPVPEGPINTVNIVRRAVQMVVVLPVVPEEHVIPAMVPVLLKAAVLPERQEAEPALMGMFAAK
jgi:hypothetical protein